jgi:hypothetical protein
LGEYCANGSVTGLAGVLMGSPLRIIVRHCEERSDEATQNWMSKLWIASLRSQ